MRLTVEKAAPCGLIVNELVSNAFKHAFAERETGTVTLRMNHRDDGIVVLTVEDDGRGISPGTDIEQSGTLGLQLVQMLTKQLGGRADVTSSEGTCFRITFPEHRA